MQTYADCRECYCQSRAYCRRMHTYAHACTRMLTYADSRECYCQSRAYLAASAARLCYFAGGFIGGRTPEFVQVMR
jgi:hypothetical protein